MIREEELRDAIAECQGERNPNANTCMKLAAFYTILDHMEERPVPVYSTAPSDSVHIDSDSEFAQAINGQDMDQVFSLVDELMGTLQIVNPRLYDGVMRKIRGWG